MVPGATRHTMATFPVTPSTERASSFHGNCPVDPMLRESVTRTVPEVVENVVVRMLVPGTYSRVTSNSSSGRSSMHPPCSASSSLANGGAESRSGTGYQSTDPSWATSATVRPLPRAA